MSVRRGEIGSLARGEALSVYDAAGIRVAEKVNDIWRNLVYDIGGKLIAEYGGLREREKPCLVSVRFRLFSG